MWSGPAPLFPFDKKRCEWLAMYMISHYCAGFITNWGVHHLDIAGWGCPEVFEKPFEIDGTGVLPSEGMTDTWISWQTELQWESGLKMSYTNSDNPNKQGCKFEGDEGWVHVNRSGIWAEPASLLDVKLGADDKPLHASPEHCQPLHGPHGRFLPQHAHASGSRLAGRGRVTPPARSATSPTSPCVWDAS